jgi:ABC-type nitrate/sulfonate/bicarbonate transport system substrate-binding protein
MSDDHRNRSRLSWFWILPLVLLIVAAAYFIKRQQDQRGATTPTNEATKVILAEGMQPVCAPVYIAADKGFFREQGLDVNLVPFSKGKLCLDAVLGGKADVATVAETPLMHVGFGRASIAILGTMHHATKNTKCVARRDKGIAKPEDLKGHKVGVPIGGNAEYFMDKFLQKYGLKREDVIVVNLNPPEMLGAIVRGDIDASFSWEPFITRSVKELGGNAVVFFGEDLYKETFNIVTMRDWADKNPEAGSRLIRALARATDFIHSNQNESIQIVAKHLQMDPQELSSIWSYYTFDVDLDQSLLDAMTAQAEWAIKSGTQKGPVPDYSYMLDTAPLESIGPSRVHVKVRPDR